jgi:hypothetical protein
VRKRLTAWAARGIRLTHVVDRAYRKFDRLRSAAVLSLGSDRFFDEYNALTYGADVSYRPDSPAFRRGLFEFEETAIGRYFPPPPARVLVGGAGGGREVFALIDKGYSVVAFEPASSLVRMMLAERPSSPNLRAFRGSYTTLPALVTVSGDARVVSLADEGPFAAAIVGWTSFSHLRSDDERSETLRQFAAVTTGPILVSYLPDPASIEVPPPSGRLARWIWTRMRRRGPSVFSVQIGYYRLLRHEDMQDVVRQAGLKVVGSEAGGSWPYVVVSRA